MAVLAGAGCKFQVTIGSTLTDVVQVTSINGPNSSVGEDIITALSDTIVKTRPTLLDPGELSLTIMYDPDDSTHSIFTTWRDTYPVTTKACKLILTDTTPSSYAFSCWLKSFNVTGMEPEGHVTAEVTVRLTTAITVA